MNEAFNILKGAALALKIGILMGSLLASLAGADDFAIGFTLEPVEKTVRKDLDKPPDRTEPQQAAEKPADLRPVVLWYTLPGETGCVPCRLLQADIDAGKLAGLRFEKRAPPEWVSGYPTLHWQDAAGTWRYVTGWPGVEKFAATYQVTSPGFDPALDSMSSLPASTPAYQFDRGVGASLIEQSQKFTGASGTFVFTPSAPIRAVLDDGTVVSFSKISGRYSYPNGQPRIDLDQPLPQVAARFWGFRFGAVLQWAENTPPSSVTVGTSRGKYVIKMQELQ